MWIRLTKPNHVHIWVNTDNVLFVGRLGEATLIYFMGGHSELVTETDKQVMDLIVKEDTREG